MKNYLLKNSLIYTAGNVLPKVVSFLLLPLITRFLTPQDYGVVTAIGAIIMFLQMTSGLQMNAGFARCYFDYHDEQKQGELLGTALLSNLLLNGAFITACLILRPALQSLYPEIPFIPFYIIGILTVPLVMVADLVQLLFRMQERPIPFVCISIFRFLTNIGFLSLLVFWKKMGALGLLLSSLLAAAISIPFILWLARRYVRLIWRRGMFRDMLHFGLQTVPYMISAAFMTNADRYLVNRLATTEQLGLYGIAWKFAMVFGVLTGAVMMSYDPHFFKTASREPPDQAKAHLGGVSTQIVVFFTMLGTSAALFGREIIQLMTAPDYFAAASILPWLILASVFGLWDGVGSEGAKFMKKMLLFTPIYLGGGLLNIGLDVWLVPKWGAAGAAVATMVCSFFIMALRFACSQKFYPVNIDYRRIGWVSLGCAGMLVAGHYIPGTFWTALVVKAVMFSVFGSLVVRWMNWHKMLLELTPFKRISGH
jgi:O-antigen/teichoic acid export membrane protein